jgi:hypothetical protein
MTHLQTQENREDAAFRRNCQRATQGSVDTSCASLNGALIFQTFE